MKVKIIFLLIMVLLLCCLSVVVIENLVPYPYIKCSWEIVGNDSQFTAQL